MLEVVYVHLLSNVNDHGNFMSSLEHFYNILFLFMFILTILIFMLLYTVYITQICLNALFYYFVSILEKNLNP